VRCWGTNQYGELGIGATAAKVFTAVDVQMLDGSATAIALGAGHTCALISTGWAKCWGLNNHGQLGVATGDISLVPVDVN